MHTAMRRARGFSLLEILVAFAIMAMSLGLLYQVMGGNARSTAGLAERERAALLAESLMAAYELVPPEGVSDSGETAGYAWRVASAPFPTPANSRPEAARLHELSIVVRWQNGGEPREFALSTLRPERLPLPGAALR